MGAYQFYDFLAVDRRLTGAQRTQLRSLSSRATITAVSFSNHYDFGDFHGDPDRLVDQFFDAHLHLAEWGTREVLFKVPRAALPLAEAEQYASESIVTVRSAGGSTVMAVRIGPDDPGASDDDLEVWDRQGGRQHWDYDSWDDDGGAGQGTLEVIADARDDLMSGDRRLLYLAWLVAVQRRRGRRRRPRTARAPGPARPRRRPRRRRRRGGQRLCAAGQREPRPARHR